MGDRHDLLRALGRGLRTAVGRGEGQWLSQDAGMRVQPHTEGNGATFEGALGCPRRVNLLTGNAVALLLSKKEYLLLVLRAEQPSAHYWYAHWDEFEEQPAEDERGERRGLITPDGGGGDPRRGGRRERLAAPLSPNRAIILL